MSPKPIRPITDLAAQEGFILMATGYSCGSVGLAKLASCGTKPCPDTPEGIRLYPYDRVAVVFESEEDHSYYAPKNSEGGVELIATVEEPGILRFEGNPRGLRVDHLRPGTRVCVRSVPPMRSTTIRS